MRTIKLTDLLCEFLKLHGVSHVFGVTGGSILHPLHSAHKVGLAVLYTHHEQAASFAADSASRLLQNPQACFVTTGPAGTNALTGVLESWQDSIPQIIVSGQARISDLTDKSTIRQIGSQHCDIISIAESITKKITQIKSADVAVEQILTTITSCNLPGERMGPVWIDIPLDMQWVEIKINDSPDEVYSNFVQSLQTRNQNSHRNNTIYQFSESSLDELTNTLSQSQRPLFVIGSGLNSSPYKEKIIQILLDKKFPMVFTWGTLDSLSFDHPLNFGLLGVNGQRSANMAAYLSDCIVGLGTHFSDQITGRNKSEFAPNGKVFMLDIDTKELAHVEKFVNGICLDLITEAPLLINCLSSSKRNISINSEQNRSTVKQINKNEEDVFPNSDSRLLAQLYEYTFKVAKSRTVFVADGGGNTFFASLQNSKPVKEQKIITTVKTGCMGSGLPQSIGAAFALPQYKVCCFIGDGSLQFNIQELMTISHNNLNISIITINNGGYQAIKDTQNSYFNSETFGVDAFSGLGIPNYSMICQGYNINYSSESLDSLNLHSSIERCLDPGSNLLEIFIPENIPMVPALGNRSRVIYNNNFPPIANMSPEMPQSDLEILLSITEW